METIPLISQVVVQKNLKYSELIPAVRQALEEYTLNRASQPLRVSLPVGDTNGTFLAMPSYSTSSDTLVTKLVSMYPDNAKKNLPTHICYITLFDPDTGALACLMDGELITAMRTAAASVVATQAIVSETPKTIAVLGSGVQARSHILAFNETYKLEKMKIWSRNHDNAQKLCEELKDSPLQNCKSVEEAVCDSDVVITVTSATEPVLFEKWLKPGCHINCVGACRPTWRECDDECMQNSTVYVDSRESAENESGDVILSKCDVYAEIGEILLKQKPVQQGKFTFFKSLGIGLQDAAAAKLVWDNCKHETDIQ
ncbi:ketimine reductase mu-crystallin-like [Styela clava]